MKSLYLMATFVIIVVITVVILMSSSPPKEPKTKPPYILEVNHSPGTAGIEAASGKNIAKEVMQLV